MCVQTPDVNDDAMYLKDEVNPFSLNPPESRDQYFTLPPITKTLRASHSRNVVACDTLSVHPDALGNRYILVVINLFTRFVHLYPVGDKSARTTASCLFQYFASYGLADVFHSDPGSDFMSNVITHLLKWLGIGRTVTLVDNPQANGVERVNQEILRHLRAICADERVKSTWSEPTVLSWIQIILNSFISSGSGYSPYDLTYGNLDTSYFNFPIAAPVEEDEFCSALAENLSNVRTASANYQRTLKKERESCSDPSAEIRFDNGDFVFYIIADKLQRGNKLNSLKKGPYMVIKHPDGSNVVSVRNLISDAIHEFNQKDLEVFTGSLEDAKRLAQLDSDQHEIDCILGYSGEPEKRTSLDFYVLFKDGDKLWLSYSADLALTASFEKFCSDIPCLRIVLLSATAANSLKRQTKLIAADSTLNGAELYINLRTWGSGWYNSLNLPNGFVVNYVYQAKIISINVKKRTYLIKAYIFNTTFEVDNWFISRHGALTFNPDDVLVTLDMCMLFGINTKLVKSSPTHA